MQFYISVIAWFFFLNQIMVRVYKMLYRDGSSPISS